LQHGQKDEPEERSSRLLGNIIGGVAMVAALNYAQIVAGGGGVDA
jgi:hypothetical protein